MKRVFATACAGLIGLAPSASAATEKVVVAPVPDWVRPVAMPAVAAGDDGTAVRILLSDQQLALEPGRHTLYTDLAFRIQTPQGLTAGNISLPWRPDTDTLTVHKLTIRRDAQVIDVLAAGQTFTVLRRESNLESATLDGVLTANIQPEGLQVGDVVEIVTSLASSDPTLRGHVEQIAGAWNGIGVARAHFRASWPSAMPIRLRPSGALPALKPVSAHGTTSVELSLDGVEPMVAPKGAPRRFQYGRLIEITDYASWADIGALLAPLFAKASVLPATGPLVDEVARIRAASPDPKLRTEAALALVEDRVRYVALVMGAGGLVPADAATTWARRYGDCKAKTALLLGVLHALGIDADAVAVGSAAGDGLDARLPLIGLFDHVVVRAVVAGRTYWLDGTRIGDTSLDRLTVPNFGWGLPLVASGATLVRMVPPPRDRPDSETTIHIDASAGLTTPAPTRIEVLLRGDVALGTNLALANLAGDARDRALRDYWKKKYDFVESRTTAAGYDAKAGELRLTMTGVATMDWSGDSYTTDDTAIGYHADFSRDPGPDRDAPFAVDYPDASRTVETIVLPKGFGHARLDPDNEVDETVAGVRYRRHATLAGNVFTIEKTEMAMVPEFPAREAPAAQAELRRLGEHNAKLRKPSDYALTDAEIAAARASTPTTAAAIVDRTVTLQSTLTPADRLIEYNKAIALDPKHVWAHADRGMTYVALGRLDDAKADLAAAQAIDPRHEGVYRLRGQIADAERRYRDAAEAYTAALALDPNNVWALGHRALDRGQTKEDEAALADAAAALKLSPGWFELRLLRGQILARRGDSEAAMAEASLAIANSPDNAGAYLGAAEIARAVGRPADAARDLAAALSRAADSDGRAYVLALRSLVGGGDPAARRADAEAASKLAPKLPLARTALAEAAMASGDDKVAGPVWDALIGEFPNDPSYYARRALVDSRLRDYPAALASSAAALKLDPALDEMYLLRANIFNGAHERDKAKSEAAAAEAANPTSVYAHIVAAKVYHAAGDDAEAMRAFDRAIAVKPEGYIYLNRADIRPRSDRAGRRADLETALRLDPTFAPATVAMGALQMETGDFAGAIVTYTRALHDAPNDDGALVKRGIAYTRAGDAAHAEQDFTAARAAASDANALNNLCWEKATAGVALASALVDCDAALAKMPGDPSKLDSRGLVLVRLGRFDEAIADYDKALAQRPTQSSSLFGRALAWAGKGDRARADTDAAAAVKSQAGVRAEFESYGLKL